MKKHILGFALFALILGSAIFVYRLIYSPTITPPLDEMTKTYDSSMTIIKPEGAAKDIYTITASSVVVDVNSRKIYAGISDEISNPSPNEFVKVVIFTENSGEALFETNWLKYMQTSNVVFRCDECAAMTSKKNYYARLYFASAPDDANLQLRLQNEKSGDFYLNSTSVLVSSGKNK